MSVYNIPYVTTVEYGKKECFHSLILDRAYTSSISGDITRIEQDFVLGDPVFDFVNYFNSDGTLKAGYSSGQTILTFPSGTYIELKRYQESSQVLAGAIFHWGNTTSTSEFRCQVWNNSQGIVDHAIFLCLCFSNTDTEYVNLQYNMWGLQGRGSYFFYANANTGSVRDPNFLRDNIPPQYTWIAWNTLAGNGGQYRCALTMIKGESIGDISSAHYGAGGDMTRIIQSSDIVPYVGNMNYNSPVKIAYSGVNWMTAEIQPDAGLLTNQVKCVFKFYIKNVSETTPFYSLTEFFFIGNDDHHYLSFVHDDEQQSAAFLPVGFDKVLTSSPYYWGNVSPSESEMSLLWLWLQASGAPTPDPQPSGPYDNGSTDNGGNGGNPIPQDDIHTPNVPVLGAMSSGMFTVYCPTDVQLGQIAQYLWSDNFIDNVKKYFNNVSDNIIAFYVLPLEPENLPTKNFKIGNLENASITGVKYLNSRFISVDMGSVTVNSRWDTYLDFSPFTRFNCYLPGVGIVALDSDDIMSPANQDGTLPTLTGSTISLTYVIDLFTGVLVAYVKINDQIRYQFPGRMGYSIPLTGQNYTAMGQGFVTAMAGLASTIATGGTAAPFTAGATAAGIVNAMKPDVYRGGNLSGDASMLSLKTPILIRTRPNKPAIENQELFSGAPSYKIDTIGNFGGFTQVVEAHIEGISCTDAERNEIMQLLRNGVLI